jgi:hypothetical protein
VRRCPVCQSENLDSDVRCRECTSPLPKVSRPVIPSVAEPDEPKPWLGPYVYKMLQVSEHIAAQGDEPKVDEAAVHLQEIVNGQAEEGWEFFRVDEMIFRISTPAPFGARKYGDPTRTYIITFRKAAEPSGRAAPAIARPRA